MSEKVVSRKNQFRSILLMVALMAVTIAVILKDYSVKELSEAVSGIHLYYLFAGIGLMFLYTGCQAVNFYLIMDSLGQRTAGINCIEYTCIGNYFNAITPAASGGQPAQMYYMSKDKIHIDYSSITIFLTVFVGHIVIILLGGFFAIFRYDLIDNSADWFSWLLLAGTVVMLGITVILSALMFSGRTIGFLMDLVFRLGKKLHLIKRCEEVQIKFDLLIIAYREKARMIIKHPALFVKVFFVTVLQWISYYMVAYLVYLSFGFREDSALDLMAGQAFINIAMAAVPLPGSVGVAEKSYLILSGQFFPEQDLTSAMILSRIINFYLPLIISFLVYVLTHHRIMKERKKNDQIKR
jgi:uncharacterized protein (TIRG00374 family)